MSTPFQHVPVLLEETLEALAIRPSGTYVDCTAGGGGHSAEIASRLGAGGTLVALDRDSEAIEAARARLDGVLSGRTPEDRPRIELIRSPFSELDAVLRQLGLERGGVDGLLADLGISSHQVDTASRGFSLQQDGPLDMRMNPEGGQSAAELLASIDVKDLSQLLRDLGDERQAWRIARAIVREREREPILRTAQLAEIVSRAAGGRRGARIHPATRTFQALRIRVNEEDRELGTLLDCGLEWLAPGGCWALISFHSGEDRPVKRRFAGLRKGCVCPPSSPICTCGELPRVELPPGGGITASPEELARNPRARTARLRVARKLASPPAEPRHEQ